VASGAETDTNLWVDKARNLAPIIEKHRDEGEKERRLPQPAFDAMQQAGLYAMYLAKSLGGPQIDLVPSLLVFEEIARHDGAVAWNLMIGAQGSMFGDYLPERAARDVYGGGDAIGAGSLGPTGQAVVVPGGYRVSGRWSFASGCHQATWFLCGCIVLEDGKPVLGPQGNPDLKVMYVPAAEATILDTWHSGGLKGPGSHDFEVSDAFVPEERCFRFGDLMVGPPYRPGIGYTQSFMLMAAIGMAAVGLGIARDALDSFRAMASEKTPSGSRIKLDAQPVVQDRFAEATALVGAARAYFYEGADKLALAAHPGDDVAAEVRLASAHAARSCERAIEIVYGLGGGSVVYNVSRLDRCFRDIHTLTHHLAVAPGNFEMVGQYLLGGPLLHRR
jgi:alkylation response protein AidB-like acyl-CoA dehydrogenase